MSEQLTFIDLFAGVGGFRRGMELAGHKCVGFCEWDKYAAMSYTAMHLATYEQIEKLKSIDKLKDRQKKIMREEYRNGEWYSNDIRSVSATNVPKCDAWCFGAPCQDFSIAGNRAGLDGDKSSLIREVFRIVGEIEEESRPEWLIYENVKGMFSSNKGFDYLEILLAMDELGYDIEWQLFNSKDFGVPQNRERVYTIGHLRRYGRREILPIGGSSRKVDSLQVAQMPSNKKWKNPSAYRVYDANGIAPTLVTSGGGGHEPYIKVECIGNVNPSGNGMNGNVFDSQGLSPTLTTNKGEGYKVMVREATNQGTLINKNYINIPQKVKVRKHEVDVESLKQLLKGHKNISNKEIACKLGIPITKVEHWFRKDDSFAIPDAETWHKLKELLNIETTEYDNQITEFIEKDGVFEKSDRCYLPNRVGPTITTGGNEKILDNMRIRKLTPRECFRLQGWTEDYFDRAALVNSDSQLYKQAGNGVTVNVVHAIAEKLTKGSVTHE